ncbi:hypothetical protein KHS38_20240 [Mucilaginibacter sp. Bleaf8]|uniref:hypothetical protein n=1 Tax=Mucilaginibacter sp. Bleaf8 TaxID=2834430 RepID=UPI001BCE7D61|nr:hypothetical protein [Mucilaginibacter sp. Bleaf8]MBS7566746.1 hypothetical protein [Mucilaginibacter sp. Bleaf8]
MGIKNYTKLLAVAAALLFSISSCKKEEEKQATRQVAVNLPSTLALIYGEETDIALPEDLLKQSHINFRLEFNETDNTQINNSSKLHDKLAKAITIDRNQGKIHVDSRLLYPNGAVSAVTGSKIPDNYKVTVIASSSQEALEGKQTLAIKIAPARLNIKGVDNKNEVPFAYVLYSNADASFELEAPSVPLDGTAWHLGTEGNLGSVVSLKGNQIQFSASAGDPKKKAEQAYDLVPALQKDGFSIALRSFRVVFIPQIKFFYGTYYSDLDLTLLFNQIHIALSNGYISAAPTLYPENYKSTFSLTSIEKDGVAFDNKDGLFELNTKTGAITVKQNSVLQAGRYKFIVKALTTTGLEFSTDLTLIMSKDE